MGTVEPLLIRVIVPEVPTVILEKPNATAAEIVSLKLLVTFKSKSYVAPEE